MNGSTKHLTLLDQLRGVAILLVLFAHTYSITYNQYDVLPWGSDWSRSFSGIGSFLFFLPNFMAPAGVPIFFVVSGFCIHLSFQQQGRRWGSFFIRRVFRIYPAYFAALVISVAFTAQHFQLSFKEIFSSDLWMHLLLIHNLSPKTLVDFNGPFWSLAVEAQLYLIYPLLLILTKRIGWKFTLSCLCLCELLIQGVWQSFSLAGDETTRFQVSWLLAHSPLGYWFSWALGAFLADAFLKKQRLPFSEQGFLLPIVTAIALACYLVKPLSAFSFTVFAMMTAIGISKLLSAPPKIGMPAGVALLVRKIGVWSYSIYLLHQPLLYVFYWMSNQLFPEQNDSIPMAFFILISTWLAVIPFSALWHHVFEIPGIELGKRLIKKLEGRNSEAVGYPAPRTLKYGLAFVVTLALCVGWYAANAKFVPLDPIAGNNLAWSLATNPDPAKRNGAMAVKLAEEACQQTDFKKTVMVGTLAAAYAEAGRYDEAGATAQKACKLADQNGETDLLKKNQWFLSIYTNHVPYHEP